MAAVGFHLGVDFGTSNTVAVLATPTGTLRQLLVDGAPVLPSAVCLTRDRRLLVGRDALHAARSQPDGFDPNPKRRVGVGSVRLAGVDVPVVDMLTAVLGRVAGEARRVAGGPVASTTLTHPAGWDRHRCAVLHTAATRAGLARVRLVPEPVAAGWSFLHAPEVSVPVGGSIVVYDFGAGTFDATVVRRTAGGFEVLATGGLTDTGGINIDAAIVAYLGSVYGPLERAAWQRLVEPSAPVDLRASILLWDDVRAGKEMLSRQPATLVHVPIFETDAPLGREQFNELARPILVRTVEATRSVIAQARLSPDMVTGLFLVGGSSRIPLAATLLHQQLGVPPTVVEAPELAVAEGCLRAVGLATPAQAQERVDLLRAGPLATAGFAPGPTRGGDPAYATGSVSGYATGASAASGPMGRPVQVSGPQPVWAGSSGPAGPARSGTPADPARDGRRTPADRTAPLWPTATPPPVLPEPAADPFPPPPRPVPPRPAPAPERSLPGDEPTTMWRTSSGPAPGTVAEPVAAPPFEQPPPPPLPAPDDDDDAFEWPDADDEVPAAGVIWTGTVPERPPAPAAPPPAPARSAPARSAPARSAPPAPARPAQPPSQPQPAGSRPVVPPAVQEPVQDPLPAPVPSPEPAADPQAQREETRRALASVRTRVDVVEHRLGTLPAALSTLRRRFVHAAFIDVEPMQGRADRQLRTAREMLAIADRGAEAGRWPQVRTAIADTRQALEEATAAVAAVTGRLAVLEKLADDPKGPAEQARFAVRDAQRLYQMLSPGVPPSFGERLDALAGRAEAAAKALGLPRPNYWELHNELNQIRDQVTATIVAMRAAR